MALDLMELLPPGWRDAMKPYLDPAVVADLERFVAREYAEQAVYPPLPDLFRALRLCAPEQTRVLILGQDPYHQPGQAHGLSFSVTDAWSGAGAVPRGGSEGDGLGGGVRVPPSLRNIFKELRDDLGVEVPASGDLSGWASQGVLLLNAVLTVRAGAPGSHAGHGWEQVTDAAIQALNAWVEPVVFLLWGGYARRKAALVTEPRHVVLEAGHPSPMNPRGFLGCRPFSAANAALCAAGREPVRWA